MKPGVSHQAHERQAVRVAQLHEARGLVGGGRGRWRRPGAAGCWRAGPRGRPSMRASAVSPCRAKAGAQHPAAAASTRPVHDGARVVDAQAVLGHHVAQARWVGSGPAREAALEVRQVLARGSHRGGVRRRPARRSRRWRAARPLGPISSGRNTPRPPPSIMAGPPMPMLLPRVAMMASQQPSSAALPAKQRPARCPPPAPGPTARRSWLKVWLSRPATTGMSTSPGRPPPPSANSTSGSFQLVRAARAAGPSWRGCASPGCRRARCSRRP
jgi:hypothetical protein